MIPLFDRVRDGKAVMFVSVITEAELRVRPERDQNQEALEKMEDFLSEDGIFVVDVSRSIARRAAKLRPANRISIADAVIMATAAETGSDLLVGNDKHWVGVSPAPYVQLDSIK